ncbi:MFS transporter [Caulobacter sp. Root1472]|uniref:MFS transporter n=1 Tax=Caulobacter sp. Root1472 TaxID=1736470 RepID=UPI0006FA43A7|nr:MFS transporter [Caulobacter sp. Root1472]KQZ29043.1 MFS transporter [Caulobacter sp. Root1472]
MQKTSARYQVMLVALLSINFGVLFFDRNALNFLMPFIQPDLKLSFTQVGLLSSALSLTWAISGILVGAWSDRAGRKKVFVVGAGIAFSLCSFISGAATSFLMLLGARLLMGAAEGVVMPVSHALVVAEVSPERRGLAMGVSQNFGSNFLGSFVAAVVLPLFAAALGWRHAFYLAAAPGLLFAVLIWFLVREPEASAYKADDRLTMTEAFKHKNMVLCVLIAILLVSYMVITLTFMPLYLTAMRGMSAQAAGWLIGVLGLSASVGSFIVPAISDRIGRRPVMILTPFLGLLIPFGALLLPGPAWLFALLFFFGWALIGLFPLFMATVPSETLPARYAATAIGISMGLGEVIGGVASPFVAGWASDVAGLDAVMWMLAALAVAAGLVALGLEETAPRKRRQPLADVAEAQPAIA